ncbi:MAG: hypothetical protein CSA72_04560 [Rhodobacterales bacterium]|nr:MAG: hypothetical protein CSA72_04560 [Rhodobacterales bacterium]
METGREIAERLNPGIEAALRDRYEQWLPGGVADSVIGHAWGQVYAREGLDMKTRHLVTVGALAVLGGQTRPQLKVNVAGALHAGASPREVCEAIFQMQLYGGLPAMINALNAAIEVFEAEGVSA